MEAAVHGGGTAGGFDRHSRWRILFQFVGLLDSAGGLEEQGSSGRAHKPSTPSFWRPKSRKLRAAHSKECAAFILQLEGGRIWQETKRRVEARLYATPAAPIRLNDVPCESFSTLHCTVSLVAGIATDSFVVGGRTGGGMRAGSVITRFLSCHSILWQKNAGLHGCFALTLPPGQVHTESNTEPVTSPAVAKFD